MDLATRTAKGVMWSGISTVITQGFQFAVKIVLARLLIPEYFGVVGMAMIFIGFVQTLNELGLSAALVQRKEIDEKHRSTMFWVSLLVGLLMTVIALAAAPLIATFFNNDLLTNVLRALSVAFFIGSLCTVHSALLQKETDFKKIAAVETTSTATYGIVSVSLAFAGLGVWSLVIGSLSQAVVRSVLYWILYPWRPSFIFDYRSFRELFSFGKNVMGSRLLNYVDSNTDYLVVGKVLDANSLGIYTVAYQIAVFPMTQISRILSRVTFPVFSIIQEEDAKIRSGFLKVVRYTSLFTFPVLVGIIILAPDFVPIVLGNKWDAMVVPLQLLCIYGIMASVGTHVGSVLLGKGRSDIQFRWNILSVIVYPVSVIIGVRFGITGVASATVISGLILFFIIQAITNRLIGLTFKLYFKALFPTVICTIVMSAAIAAFKGVTEMFSMEPIVFLIGGAVIGACMYMLALRVLYNDIIAEFIYVIKLAISKTGNPEA